MGLFLFCCGFSIFTRMKFTDYRMKELVGKSILWISGGEGKGTVKTVAKISRVLSAGFMISCDDERIFNYYNGHQKAITGRMNHAFSYCKLVNDDQINDLTKLWDELSVKQELVASILLNKKKMLKLSTEQLQQLDEQLQQS